MTLEEKNAKKEAMAAAQLIKDQMTVEQKIQFLNTPYKDMPDELKVGMVKNPQKFMFVKMKNHRIGDQKETFGARLIRYRAKYSLSQKDFCELAEEYGKNYKVHITLRDMNNYENYNVSPKIDKMTLIEEVMGMKIDYFAGYGAEDRTCRNEKIESRYRAKRGKKNAPRISGRKPLATDR